MSGISFTSQIKKEMGDIKNNLSSKISRAAISAWEVAVDATPRLTGNLQNSWKLSTDRRSSYIPKPGNKPRPTKPNFRFDIKKDARIYLFNNVPYASHVENGEGRGARVPRLMLKKAIEHLKSELSRLR